MAWLKRQNTRIAALNTPLGTDKLVLTNLHISEGVSELFEIRVEALSEERNIDFDKVLGLNCSINFVAYGLTSRIERLFNGVLVAADWDGETHDAFRYTLVLKPWLWLLSRRSNNRIFANQSVRDIISEVLSGAGFSDFKMKLFESYDPIEYCVQYNESDLDFVLRLMEEYGIYYYFEHTAANHTLVLCDSKSSHAAVPNLATVPMFSNTNRTPRKTQYVETWAAGRRFETGSFRLTDYNFEKSKSDLSATESHPGSYSHGDFERFDYPGGHEERPGGEKFAKVKLQALQAQDKRRYATGDAASLLPGGTVTLSGHYTAAENAEYLVLRCEHRFGTDAYRSGEGDDESYTGRYEFLPADIPFRAPQTTPKPRIPGVQIATVVGEGEIDVDKFGRILVQFPWDKAKKQSRRVRVVQPWAGAKWGHVFIPRVGMEVWVMYQEGDPDRPTVIGAAYNDQNMPPWTLPSEKTRSGIKSNSTTGGGGYNEISLEDKKGSEQIRVHAQKNLDTVILNKETRTIGHGFKPPKDEASRDTILKNGDDWKQIEKGNELTWIDEGDQELTISKGDRVVAIDKGDDHLTIGTGSRLTSINKDEHLTIKQGDRKTLIEMGNDSLQLKMGNRKTKFDLGSDKTEAMQSIEFVVGQSSIKLDQMGVTIKGMMIKIDAQVMLEAKSLMTTVKGDALLVLKGGLVLIN